MGKKRISSFVDNQSDFTRADFSDRIADNYSEQTSATLYLGDRLELLRQIPPKSARLVITSPPYNIGKEYERQHDLDVYLEGQRETISACYEALADDGSLCWQVGNHIRGKAEILPLDIPIYDICNKLGMKLRNRVVWHFEHGLHCTKRFSGRYETIMWFTKSDNYVFNLDSVRVPQKYPGKKQYKGKDYGEYSCNPLGKNPGDVWVIPNVKSNHCEKTVHPCQFPVELVARLVLAMTNKNDLVIDPYVGVGSAICAAVMNGRRGAGADISKDYLKLARERVLLALQGKLVVRPLGKPVYDPTQSKLSIRPQELQRRSEEVGLFG